MERRTLIGLGFPLGVFPQWTKCHYLCRELHLHLRTLSYLFVSNSNFVIGSCHASFCWGLLWHCLTIGRSLFSIFWYFLRIHWIFRITKTDFYPCCHFCSGQRSFHFDFLACGSLTYLGRSSQMLIVFTCFGQILIGSCSYCLYFSWDYLKHYDWLLFF